MKKFELTITAQSIENDYSADISVVIDVLRASSVIITALANDTPFIIPASSIDETMELSKKYPNAILAGERNAIKISGFDRGNSPLECLAGSENRPMILSTTNGTLSISKVRLSHEILIASFLNINAIVDYIKESQARHIHIACAGTNGQFSLDDYLMAGGLISKLKKDTYELDDLSVAATQLYDAHHGNLHRALENTKHYKTLQQKGFHKDLLFCLRENIFQIVPQVTTDQHKQLIIHKV